MKDLNRIDRLVAAVEGELDGLAISRQQADVILSYVDTASVLHPDDLVVDTFAIAMKEKLALAREKGRGGWQECDPVALSLMLREHVEKGDPRDVANFCMFLWALNQPISDATLPYGKRATPLTDEQRAVAYDTVREALGNAHDCTRIWSAWNAGTMSEDDFALITENDSRVSEIADAATGTILPFLARVPAVESDTFQSRVQPWMLECFGAEIAADGVERNHRFFEEATELVQACGMTASEAHQLVDYVYGRPAGEKHQEIGGVMVTLAALCLAQGEDMHAAGETELARVWTKVAQIRAKQAAKPKHSPLPEHPAAQRPGVPEGVREVITLGDFSVELRFHSCRQAQAFIRAAGGQP